MGGSDGWTGLFLEIAEGDVLGAIGEIVAVLDDAVGDFPQHIHLLG